MAIKLNYGRFLKRQMKVNYGNESNCAFGDHTAMLVQRSVVKNVPLLSGSDAHPAVCQAKRFSQEGGISQEHLLHPVSHWVHKETAALPE